MKSNFFTKHACEPWAIMASKLALLGIANPIKGEVLNVDMLAANGNPWRDRFFWVAQRPEMEIDVNEIAHIYVHGVLLNGATEYDLAANGGTSYNELLADIKKAEGSAKGIMLHFDSGGGVMSGNQGVVDAVANCKIPVFAYAGNCCCSAAYNIASQASYISARNDSQVGSIGVILPLLDISAFWESMGVKADYITNKEGDLKGSGYMPSQSEKEKEFLQSMAQTCFEMFKANVLKNRTLDEDTMRGQFFIGKEAKARGLVDEVESFEACYKKLQILTNSIR